MSRNNYTEFMQESISNYPSCDETKEAISFLKNPDAFRSFDEGLVELLQRIGYQGNLENKAELSDYLFSRLQKIGGSRDKKTVSGWFLGKHRPKVEIGYRRQIYEICFALNLTHEDTVWFFHHVYYDRAFNCHNIEEAVFYYAFLHSISYSEANSIIDRVNKAASSAAGTAVDTTSNYTKQIQRHIDDVQSIDELEEYLSSHKRDFIFWNKSALSNINSLRCELIASDNAKELIDDLKFEIKKGTEENYYDAVYSKYSEICEDEETLKECGLLMRELFYDAFHNDQNNNHYAVNYMKKAICGTKKKSSGKDVKGSPFVLERMLGTASGISKTAVPDIVHKHFPSQKEMSDILSESETVKLSYDSIRKMIVLLDFYAFWIPIKIGLKDKSGRSQEDLYEIYQDEANFRLSECGYEEMFPGNPYDWLFLKAAFSDDPLTYLRSCMAVILSDNK